VRRLLAELGVDAGVLQKVYDSKSQQEGEQNLEAAKEVCKKGYHAIALELHPDVTGGDVEKEKRFRELKNVYEGFMSSKYKHHRRRVASTNVPFPVGAPPAWVFGTRGMWAFRQAQREAEVQAAARRRSRTGFQSLDDLVEKMRQEAEAGGVKGQGWSSCAQDEIADQLKEMRRREREQKEVPLRSNNGIWIKHKGRWVLRTKRRGEK
jgi:DnaJ-class molecular chaperone